MNRGVGLLTGCWLLLILAGCALSPGEYRQQSSALFDSTRLEMERAFQVMEVPALMQNPDPEIFVKTREALVEIRGRVGDNQKRFLDLRSPWQGRALRRELTEYFQRAIAMLDSMIAQVHYQEQVTRHIMGIALAMTDSEAGPPDTGEDTVHWLEGLRTGLDRELEGMRKLTPPPYLARSQAKMLESLGSLSVALGEISVLAKEGDSAGLEQALNSFEEQMGAAFAEWNQINQVTRKENPLIAQADELGKLGERIRGELTGRDRK